MWSAQLNICVLKKSALPLFNQRMVLCVLLQHKGKPQTHCTGFSTQWINDTQPFHNRFCHDCFFFCTLISKKRNYSTQSFLKKRLKKGKEKATKAQLLPCWAEHLWASAVPAQNYKNLSYKPACWQFWHPRLQAGYPPLGKWGYQYFHCHLQLKSLAFSHTFVN